MASFLHPFLGWNAATAFDVTRPLKCHPKPFVDIPVLGVAGVFSEIRSRFMAPLSAPLVRGETGRGQTVTRGDRQ